MKKIYTDFIKDIIDSIDDIERFIGNMSFDEFLQDRKTINAVIRSLEIIGEASKKIPPEIRDKNTSVPWKRMTGMRDKLIHEYFGVDMEIVWMVIKEELPPLKSMIMNILKDLEKEAE